VHFHESLIVEAVSPAQMMVHMQSHDLRRTLTAQETGRQQLEECKGVLAPGYHHQSPRVREKQTFTCAEVSHNAHEPMPPALF
jgi:hypothetical protein